MPKESTSTTIITERLFQFTRADVEILLRREILGADLQAKVVFDWDHEPNTLAGANTIVRVVNTVTEYK